MTFTINTKGERCTIEIQIKTWKPEVINIVVLDPAKNGMKYIDRFKTINGTESIFCRMPVSPDVALVLVYNKNNGNINRDTTFSAQVRKIDLLCKGIVLTPETKSFLKAVSWFAQNARVYDPNMRVMTHDGLWCFEYVQQIYKIDEKTGAKFAEITPAMIGKESGIVTMSYNAIKDRTVPAIIFINMHERYHLIYKDDEEKCDRAACNVVLSLGFPKTALYEAVCYIFDIANTPENEERFLKMKNYIENFNYNQYYKEK